MSLFAATTREGIETDSSEDDEEASASTTALPAEPPLAEAAEAGLSEESLAAAAAAAAAEARSRAANAALRRLSAFQHRPASDGAATATATAAAATAVEAGEEMEAAASARVVSTVGSSEGTEKEMGGKGLWAGGGEEEEEVDVEGLTEVAGEAGAGLLAAAGVRTIGQLADCDEEELTRELSALREGEALPTGGDSIAGDKVQAEKVAEWVQAARGEELDEIMAEIVGGDDDVVEVRELEYVLFLGSCCMLGSRLAAELAPRRIDGCTAPLLHVRSFVLFFLCGVCDVLHS